MMLEKCITYWRMRKCYVNLLKMKQMTLKIKYCTGKRWRYCWFEAFSSVQINSCLKVLISIPPPPPHLIGYRYSRGGKTSEIA
jgi:hypothetical protein